MIDPTILAPLLAPALQAAGVSPQIASLVGAVAPEVAGQLVGMLQRHAAGEPIEAIIRAQAPDPTGALDRVDREDER